MGKLAILQKPAVALIAVAFPLVAAGAFALGAGYDLGTSSPAEPAAQSAASDSAASDSTATETGANGKPVDPLAASRKSLQDATLPISFLSGGVSQLTDGGKQLNDGVVQLTDGITQAHDGTIQLADGFGQYRDGIGQLGDGASLVSGGVDQIVDQLTGLGAQQSDITAKMEAAAAQIQSFGTPGSGDVAAQIRSTIDQLNTQALGPQTLGMLDQLKGGARQLAFELDDPSSTFLGATGQLSDATVQLRDGLGQLDDGGQQLRGGTEQLVTAVGPVSGVVSTIATNVNKASAALPSAASSGATETNEGISAASSTTPATPVAPFLIAALVAVGAVGCVSLVRVLTRGAQLRWIAAAAAIFAVGVTAALAFAFTATDVDVLPMLGAGAFLVVSAAAYLAAAGAIQRAFGAAVGQIVNISLLLIQVLVCGAAYASSASIWSDLAVFAPMSYTAAGAREIGYGQMTGSGWLAIAVTAALLAVSAIVYRATSGDGNQRMDGGRTGQMVAEGS